MRNIKAPIQGLTWFSESLIEMDELLKGICRFSGSGSIIPNIRS